MNPRTDAPLSDRGNHISGGPKRTFHHGALPCGCLFKCVPRRLLPPSLTIELERIIDHRGDNSLGRHFGGQINMPAGRMDRRRGTPQQTSKNENKGGTMPYGPQRLPKPRTGDFGTHKHRQQQPPGTTSSRRKSKKTSDWGISRPATESTAIIGPAETTGGSRGKRAAWSWSASRFPRNKPMEKMQRIHPRMYAVPYQMLQILSTRNIPATKLTVVHRTHGSGDSS